MRKQTEYLVIGIGIASILAGIYGGYRTGELMDSLSGVLIGVALIGTKSSRTFLVGNYLLN